MNMQRDLRYARRDQAGIERLPASAEEIRAAKAVEPGPSIADPAAFIRHDENGDQELFLMIGGMTCAACIYSIEKLLDDLPGIQKARANLTTRRLHLRWNGEAKIPQMAMARLHALGYDAVPFDQGAVDALQNREDKALLRALGIAAFGMMNIMLLSISVWAGHAFDMAVATRDLFHWVSALIAMPIVFFAGQPFFRSAFTVLRKGRSNMDVPISLALVLAVSVSLYESFNSGPHAWFDAAVMLLTFLLAGRYLDQRMRMKAQTAANHLSVMTAMTAHVLDGDDQTERLLPANQVQPGMVVRIVAGDVIPVDGVILDGEGDIDTSLVTGESLPRPIKTGDQVFAGTVNMSASLLARADKDGRNTLLQDIVGLMEAAEDNKSRYRRIADRAASLYAPVVHIAALVTFLGWFVLGDLGARDSILIAMAVLIITCPCALALAVPAVQVVASGRLMKQGILLKSGDALERLADIDAVVFDKTGTLTQGQPSLRRDRLPDADAIDMAVALARHSRHPLAKALLQAASPRETVTVRDVVETAGQGIAALVDGQLCRLGRRDFCGLQTASDPEALSPAEAYSEVWLDRPGHQPVCFQFHDPLKDDAVAVVKALQAKKIDIYLLSGDHHAVVCDVAATLDIQQWQAGCHPADKVAAITDLQDKGLRVAMVGDGINDAPSLATADVSLSPASASDISRTAADIVFQGQQLQPVCETIDVSKTAKRLVNQNFALAVGYNILAIPLAVAGYVTPLIAALAMSGSSILVTLNAMRLGWFKAMKLTNDRSKGYDS